MIALFKSVFCPNWVLVYTESATWNLTITSDFYDDYKEKRKCFYHIYYSKSRNKYKLITSGYKPKQHPWYKWAMQDLAKFQSKL
jgi:hypothetical protein